MPDERRRWLDEPANVRRIYRGLWVLCAVLLVAGEAVLRLGHDPGAAHVGFAFESWPGFHALFGFSACVALVLAARELRKLLMREENYYDD